MNLRKWWLQKEKLEFHDEMQAEARTRALEINTFPILKTDIPVVVFTEEELHFFAAGCWIAATAKQKTKGRGWRKLYARFADYWKELDINDEKEVEF